MAETPLERVDALLLREDHAQQGEATGGDAMAPRGRGRRPAGLPVPFRGEVAPARDAPFDPLVSDDLRTESRLAEHRHRGFAATVALGDAALELIRVPDAAVRHGLDGRQARHVFHDMLIHHHSVSLPPASRVRFRAAIRSAISSPRRAALHRASVISHENATNTINTIASQFTPVSLPWTGAPSSTPGDGNRRSPDRCGGRMPPRPGTSKPTRENPGYTQETQSKTCGML